MAMLIREMAKQYQHILIDLSDPRTIHWPLLSSPMTIVAIIGFYIYFVHHLGPRIMKDRPAYKLDRLMQVYNIIQVVLACYLVERGWNLGWGYGKGYKWMCQPVDFSNDPAAVETARCSYLYFLIKIIDLMDTVFFVLRKNYRQITFLHVYHHSGMVLGSWVCIKYLPGGHGSLLGVINSVVHAVMYSYYFITSIRPEQKKNIWWKKYITQMQMIQFLMVTCHNVPLVMIKDCAYPTWFGLLVVPQNLFMLILFYDFYRKAYNKKTPVTATNGSTGNIEDDRKHSEVFVNGDKVKESEKKIH